MNWVDIVIIVIALLGAYKGLKQGLIRTVFTAIGLIVGIALAGQWSDSLADKLSSGEAQWAYITAFAIIVIVVLITANIIGAILKRFIKIIMIGWLDSLGGTVLGFCVGALLAAAILASLGSWAHNEAMNNKVIGFEIESELTEAIGDSSLAELLIDNFGLVLGLLPGEFDAVKGFF